MRRKLICLLLSAVLVLGLCACGGSSAPSGSGDAGLPGGKSYSEIYMQYLEVRTALLESVELRVGTNNAVLKEQFADSYYMNSNYLVLTYVPFSTVYPGLVSTLTDGDLTGAQTELRSAFPDAVLAEKAPGIYEASSSSQFLDSTTATWWRYNFNGVKSMIIVSPDSSNVIQMPLSMSRKRIVH